MALKLMYLVVSSTLGDRAIYCVFSLDEATLYEGVSIGWSVYLSIFIRLTGASYAVIWPFVPIQKKLYCLNLYLRVDLRIGSTFRLPRLQSRVYVLSLLKQINFIIRRMNDRVTKETL